MDVFWLSSAIGQTVSAARVQKWSMATLADFVITAGS
jgi:hypothetical protein